MQKDAAERVKPLRAELAAAYLLDGEAVDEVLGETEELDGEGRARGRAAEREEGQHDFGGSAPEDCAEAESNRFLGGKAPVQDGGIEGSGESAEGGMHDERGDHGRNGGFGAMGQKAAGGQAGRLRHAKHGLEADTRVGHPSGSRPTPQPGPERELQERHKAGAQDSTREAEEDEVWRVIVLGVGEGFSRRAHFR